MSNTGRTHFRKGSIPWNKGKKGVTQAWNKGLHTQGHPMSEKAKKQISETKRSKKLIGKKSHMWKGGILKHSEGYILRYCSEHPFKSRGNYVYEHRLIMEKSLGRYLKPQEVIHHINHLRSDNRLKNLMLIKNLSEHQKIHSK